MRNLLKYFTVIIFFIPLVSLSIPVSELIAPLTALKVYPPNGGGGGSTIVTASTPIVSTEVTGGYNISCPTCTTGSLLAYQQAFGVPAAGSISGGPYVTIGATSDMHFTYGTGLTFTSANLVGKIYQYLDNNYIWHFSPYLSSPMNGVQVDTGSSVILSDSTDTSKVKLKNNAGNLEVTGEGGSIGTINTTGVISAERGASFGDDVAIKNGKSLGFFDSSNTKLSTINLDASGNLNNLGAANYKFNAPIVLSDPTNTYSGSISKSLFGGIVPAMLISSDNTIITGDDKASPGKLFLGFGSELSFQNPTNSGSTDVSMDSSNNLNFTGPVNYTFDSNLLLKNGTTLELQSGDQAAQSTLRTDDDYNLVQNSQNSIKLTANNGDIELDANSFITHNSTIILKNKNTGITVGTWDKNNGALGIIDPETGLSSAYLSIKTVDGQNWLEIGDGNTTQPMAFNHNTNKNGVVYLDDYYRMNTPVLLSGQALIGNTGTAPTPQNILLSTTPLNSIAAPNADVSLNNYKIIDLTPGTLSTDAVTVGQLSNYLTTTTPLNSIAAPTNAVDINNQNINNVNTITTNNVSWENGATVNFDNINKKLNFKNAQRYAFDAPIEANGIFITGSGSGVDLLNGNRLEFNDPINLYFSNFVMDSAGTMQFSSALKYNFDSTPTVSNVPLLLSTTPLNFIAAPNADVSLNNYKINNLKPGTLSTDAATVGQANTALAKVYYVSTTGNDVFGTGSQTAPFSTVNKALSLIPANNATNVTIYVAPGSYTENIIVTKQRVDIVGMEAPSSQPKAIKFPSISITTVGGNVGDYVDNGVSISNLTFAARSGIEAYAISYTGSNLFVSLNDVLIGNDANIDGILMSVTDSSRLYINNSSINVSGTAAGMKFTRGELWDFRNSACTSGNADCIVASTNNVAIYSAINSSFSSNFHVFNFTGSNNKGVIATFSQCFIQGVPTGNLNTDAIIQLGASFTVSFNNSSLVNAGGIAQVGNAIVYLGSSSALLLTYSSVSSTATNTAAFVPFKSQIGNNSILQYYGNVFLSSGGANVYSKPVSGVGGFLLVSKMQTDS